ncbi:NAD(P)H-binding protein, PF13460 family [Leptospira broomii serovar Hurstbridge str. 5399]|uniref:NAD(P)H-binding protein, PF13460 family n=1 Tax=Leptospira broomii serovar Hurstbridge str. 5399 TaxID=1049789 RepID=T0FAF4_9LEPT|nr:SDR family oxidoreductase [Leptospira broomii]EQA44881.1 NAD(P)H-binding protein, PF13460 family [Leptospira broomii serovar Hurstbridge str. 5399]
MSKQIAIVTGASRGIGKQVSKELAASGVHVLCCSRKSSDSAKTVNEIEEKGGSGEAWELDVADPNSIQKFLKEVLKKHSKIDILVNNAGIYLDSGNIETSSLQNLNKTLETNLIGPYLLAKEILPVMKRNKFGRIVNVSSGLGQLSDMGPGYAAYRISKAGLNALTKILDSEAGSGNIKVNSICPGWVRTDMGGAGATRSIEQGAETIVWAALLADDGPRGKFLRDKKEIPW